MARRRSKSTLLVPLPTDDNYPRPMLVRLPWLSLDGPWEFALDREASWQQPSEVLWSSTIQVPFAPETAASGLNVDGYIARCWYRLRLRAKNIPKGDRVILHFGAVDYFARVWINGRLAIDHEGGYLPFSVDVTDFLREEELEIVLRADDDPHDLAKPRGKQDWHKQPHSIWYPRTTGIWQTVWMEAVPFHHIDVLRWEPILAQGEIRLYAHVNGPQASTHRLRVLLRHGTRVICDDLCSIDSSGDVRRCLPVASAGTEDFAIDVLWTPENPRLIDAELMLLQHDGSIIDSVRSYTALRAVGIDGDRFVLNRRPRMLRLVLHQGYWPESGLTPPDADAYRRDIDLVKSLGFDGVRMHQKIEAPRFLACADRMGLLVWEEMPSPYVFSTKSVQRSLTQWAAAVLRDASHPSIIVWVPTNESWGTPDLPTSNEQRAFVRALYELTKSLDPTRPVVGNDGWEMNASDITAIHDYDADPKRLAQRYHVASEAELIESLKRERPGHRRIILEDYEPRDRPVMLTEFGGIAFSNTSGSWGYSRAQNSEQFIEQYTRLLAAVRSIPILAGWCFTQFTDTYQEANGLVSMDRIPKADPARIRHANRD